MPSLLDMTDVPMTNILEKCDFKSVLTLRKVCHDLRNFIDDANFKTELTVLQITINSIDFSFKSYSKNGPAGAAEHCTLDDLKTILGIQNSKLSTFSVITHPKNSGALDDLVGILKNKRRPLQTEILELDVSKSSQILNVLPHFDSKVLKSIRISCSTHWKQQKLEEIKTIMELDQFKNSSELAINDFSVDADLKKFFHFQSVSVEFETGPLEDFVALKEAFTTSPHMQEFRLHQYQINELDQFEREFGAPSKDTPEDYNWLYVINKKWYFKMHTSKDDVLEIYYTTNIESDGLSFKRIKATDVEKNLVVRD